MVEDEVLDIRIPFVDDEWSLDDFLANSPPALRWPVPATNQLLAELVPVIVEHFHPRTITLFGSRARGDNRTLRVRS